jgi:dTDP-4-dehydrorhamnose reductase
MTPLLGHEPTRVLIAGADGQLGRALLACLGDRVAWSGGRAALDVRDTAAVHRVIFDVRPDVVFNAAAYNNVDGAETETCEALAVNACGPRNLARACRDAGALLVHVSTDYVFDGGQSRPYTEEDRPRPPNAYGVSKLAGEQLVAASGCAFLTVRTSALFGGGRDLVRGGSFIPRVIEQARNGQALRMVADQVFSPTYAPDLARALVGLVGAGARGLVHVTNSGSCSWYSLAVAAIERAGIKAEVAEIHARDLLSPARRPPHSILSKERYESLGLPPLRAWSEALDEFVTR